MGLELDIRLPGPVKSARIVVPAELVSPHTDPGKPSATDDIPAVHMELDRLRMQLQQACKMVEDLAAKVADSYQQMVGSYKQQIARLAVEIARKIISKKISEGDYDMETIIAGALEKAPVKQSLAVHVNPKDLEICMQIKHQGLTFIADPDLRPAECIVESPKGLVKCLIDEQLAKIQYVLETAG